MLSRVYSRLLFGLLCLAVLGVLAGGGAQPDLPTFKTCKPPEEVAPNTFVYEGQVKEDHGRLTMFRDDTGKWYWTQKCVEGDQGTAAQKKQGCQCFEMTAQGFDQYLRDRDAKNRETRKAKSKERLEKMMSGGSGNGGGGNNCFAAGTYVLLADGGFKDIRDIRIGDRVLSVDPETGTELAGRVYETREGSESFVYVLNSGLRVNAAHKFYTSEGLKTAPEMVPGDLLRGRGGQRPVLSSVERRGAVLADAGGIGPDIRVYNIMVADTHTFFVTQDRETVFLVHDDCSCGN